MKIAAFPISGFWFGRAIQAKTPLTALLSGSGVGRIILHLLCLFRRPGHLCWHWRGIARELVHVSKEDLA